MFCVRVFIWLDDRLALQEILDDVSSKFVPPHVKLFYCFGGLVLFSVLVQVATGFALTFYYRPSVSDALASVRAIMSDVHSGWLIRSGHRWGASLMVCCIVLHVCRVYLTGGFKKPREVTWITGVALAVCTGGPSVGQATLTRFYSLHTFVLPLVTLGLMLMHFLPAHPTIKHNFTIAIRVGSHWCMSEACWPVLALMLFTCGLLSIASDTTLPPGTFWLSGGSAVEWLAAQMDSLTASQLDSRSWLPVVGGSFDVNVTAGLALAVSHSYFYAGVQTRSLGYLERYVSPVAYLLPINLLEDFSKPLSLSFRLLGNILADELTIAVLSSLVAFIVPVAVMCLGIFTSAIQALVFVTLAAYIGEGEYPLRACKVDRINVPSLPRFGSRQGSPP